VPPVTVITERAEEPEDGLEAFIDQTFPVIDWHELWGREDDELDWIIEPLLPARRLVAMYSPPKVGKSLLMLEIAAAVATGRKVLGGETRQCRVLYVDFENDPVQDTRTRLMQMGYGPDEITGRLFMLSFPTLAALDCAQGAQELLAVAERHQAQAIIIDTVSRAVKGEENDNDTWLAFYRHTGLRLKQAGIALMRLDHSGKDITKGQRGGSAKVGDVDAVWRLDRISEADGETTLTLKCEAQRFPFPETELTLKRRGHPLRHDVEADPKRAANEVRVADCVKALDAAEVPHAATLRDAMAAIRARGWSGRNQIVSQALNARGGTILREEDL
jgi:RecA-family ATPase